MNELETKVRAFLTRELSPLAAEAGAQLRLSSLEVIRLVTILEKELNLTVNPMVLQIPRSCTPEELVTCMLTAFSPNP